MNQNQQANIIKIAAVVTATPRWIGALLAAEGMVIPESWDSAWIWFSLILNAAMAIVEGLAFAYVFNAWRNQTGKAMNKLLYLALFSAAIFVIVLSPFIAAQVRSVPLETVLGTGWPLWLWSASVATSTISIVASVGYAQKAPSMRSVARTASARSEQAALAHTCWCGQSFANSGKKAAHIRYDHYDKEIRSAASPKAALDLLRATYPDAFGNGKSPVTIADIRKVRG